MSGFSRKLQQSTSGARGNILSLSPSSGTYSNGSSLVVTITENSHSVPVNSVQANLTYNPALLQYQSADASTGGFTTVLQKTGGSGSVQLGLGSLSGSQTGSTLVATVTFTVIGTGTTAVPFAAGSAIYQSSNGANILDTTSGATYQLV